MSSKSKRRFAIPDGNALTKGYEYAAQIEQKIAALSDTEEDITKSLVSTEVLLVLAIGFKSMYDALVEEELLHNGYFSKSNKLH